jgi:hypothetical protein
LYLVGVCKFFIFLWNSNVLREQSMTRFRAKNCPNSCGIELRPDSDGVRHLKLSRDRPAWPLNAERLTPSVSWRDGMWPASRNEYLEIFLPLSNHPESHQWFYV